MERLCTRAFAAVEGSTKSHPVLMADSPDTSERDRMRMCELMFEKFNVPAYFVGTDAVFGVYSAGRTSSMVIDMGHSTIHTMLVHDGFIVPPTMSKLDLGGDDITILLEDLLIDRGVLARSHTSKLIANSAKETKARVPLDFAQEANACRTKKTDTFTLPDGNEVVLEGEHLRCAEALFQPALVGARGVGMHEGLIDMVKYCDGDRDGGSLKALSGFLLMTGGGSFINGLEERIKKEFAVKYKTRELFVSCLREPERHHAAWLGGSILSCLPSFVDNNFVTRAEYQESGAAAVNQKCC